MSTFFRDEHTRWALFFRLAAEMNTLFQMNKQDEHLFYRWATQMSTFFQMSKQDEHDFSDEQVINRFNLIISGRLTILPPQHYWHFASRPTPRKVQKWQKLKYNLNMFKNTLISRTHLKKNNIKIRLIPPIFGIQICQFSLVYQGVTLCFIEFFAHKSSMILTRVVKNHNFHKCYRKVY